MIQGMEMRHLQTFVIAAESQNFTRAADTLGLTQAAVSQHMAALEKELAVSLFKRTGRAVMLTNHGRTLYEYARGILELAQEARDRITGASQVIRGMLKIAASTVPSEWLLPKLLVSFRKSCPEVQESVFVSDSIAAIRAVESGEAELGIVGELPRAARLCAKAIASDELTLVVPANHNFAKTRHVTLDQLRKELLIVRESDSGSRHCVEEALSNAGLPPSALNIALEVNSNEAIRAAVECGFGVAFLSSRAIAREAERGTLVPVAVQGVSARRHLYLITDPERMPTRVARAFISFVYQWSKQQTSDRRGA